MLKLHAWGEKVMKAKEAEGDKYGYIKSAKATGSRLDLNDLLKRMEDQKKDDKKINILIISGVFVLAVVFFLILSL